MKTFKRLWISKLPFGGAPVEGALKVIGSHDENYGNARAAGWLMPPVAEVHPKTARWQAHMRRYGRGK